MDIVTYKTIASITQAEFKDKGSRFIAFAYPIQTLEEVKQYVSILREEHPNDMRNTSALLYGVLL